MMQYIQNFITFLTQKNSSLSAVTLKNYRADVNKFIQWVTNTTGSFTPSLLNADLIEEFKSHILATGSAASWTRYKSSLKLFYEYLIHDHAITENPFAHVSEALPEDPYTLLKFKNQLFAEHSSHLTVKNYVIDIKQFLTWAEAVTNQVGNDLLPLLTNDLLQEYKNRLVTEQNFSPASINRKLSSVRKYLSWQGMTEQFIEKPILVSPREKLAIHATDILSVLPEHTMIPEGKKHVPELAQIYSAFPPIRLVQRISNLASLVIDACLVAPTIHLSHMVRRRSKNASVFITSKLTRHITNVRNLPKGMYAPLTTYDPKAPWYKKMLYHILHTRPEWFTRYQKTTVAQYFNLLVVLVFAAIIGVGVYINFIQKANNSLAAQIAPLRILSFQGRLTDTNDNPTTSQKWIRFIIYNDSAASGSARLWEEVRQVTPDSDGIFSVLLGSNGSGGAAATCNGNSPPSSPATGACGIMQPLFAQNQQLYLGVTIENTAELSPRQQLATVSFATNSEMLQGLPPTTDTTNVTTNTNTVLALNSSGTVDISGTSGTTTVQYVGNQFNLIGKVLSLQSASGTGTNIQFIPDGLGAVDAQKSILNTTLNGNLVAASDGAYTTKGAVEVRDLFAVLATSSGQSAFTLNQDSTGPVFSASRSGAPVFNIDGSGNTTVSNNLNVNSAFNVTGGTLLNGNVSLGDNTGDEIQILGLVAGSILPSSSGSPGLYDIGSSARPWKTVYADSFIPSATSGTIGWWQRNTGALSPTNITDDVLFGATGTTSAKFAFLNNFASGNGDAFPVASFSATNKTARTGLVLSTDGSIQSLLNSNLTLGGTSTGNIILSPLNNSGRVGVDTAAPSEALDVSGNIRLNNLLSLAGGPNAYQTTFSNSVIYNSASTGGSYPFLEAGNLVLQSRTSGAARDIVFATGTSPATRMVIDRTGNIGIGTTTTPSLFNLSGTNVGKALAVFNETGTNDIIVASVGGVLKARLDSSAFWYTSKFIDIDNASSMYYLDPATTGSSASLAGSLTFSGISAHNINYLDGSNIAFQHSVGGDVGLSTTPTLYLANAGNVGVGTSTPNALFNIVSTATTTQTASISATSNTTGTIFSIVPPNPTTNLTGNIFNFASADHTFANLTNQDLTLGGHKNITNIGSVKKVFVYDTSKDSDGGKWTNDERAQASSWYSETLNAANVRGSTRPFPRKAILVVTTAATGALQIYDAKDNSLWMQFNKGATTTEQMVGPTTNSTGQSVFALNGKIYFANSGSAGGLYVIDFIKDSAYRYTATNYSFAYTSLGQGAIVNRNSTTTWVSWPSMVTLLASTNVNDVFANIINGKTYIAVATTGGTNGAVTLINESDQALVANYGPASINAAQVYLTANGSLYATIASGSAATNYIIKAKHNAQNGSGNTQLFSEAYYTFSTTTYGATTSDSNTLITLANNLTAGPASTSATLIPTALWVTEGTSTVDGKSNTIYVGAQGSSGSVMAIQEKQSDPSNGSIKYYYQNGITDEMVGDIRAFYPLDSTFLGSGLGDASIKGNTLTNNGMQATGGVRGGAASLTTAAEAHSTSASLLVTFKSAMSVSAWVDPTSAADTTNGVRHVWVSADQNGSANALAWGIGTKGDGTSANITCIVGTGTNTLTDVGTNIPAATNVWYHVVLTSDSSGNVKCYVNGELVSRSDAVGGTAITPTQFEIGATRATTAITGITGIIDEVGVTAETLTGAEIARMYQVGTRALQNHTANTIRGVSISANNHQKFAAAQSNVQAVTASMQNGMIYIGTQPGGVSVIGQDSDTLMDLYSSSMTTHDDIAVPWSTNNDFVNSISLGQSYGNGMILSIGSNTSNNGGVWMESNDSTLKDWMATNYNPFGGNLTQTNLNVESTFRVTNPLSTRFDNLAQPATSSASLYNLFQVGSDGTLTSNSVSSNATGTFAFNNFTETHLLASSGNTYGMLVTPSFAVTGTEVALIGFQSSPTNSSTGTITSAYGVAGIPINSSTGTITSAYGLYGRIDNNSTGTITTGYGLYIENPTNNGTFTNKYAIVTNTSAGNSGFGMIAPDSLVALNGQVDDSETNFKTSSTYTQMTLHDSDTGSSGLRVGYYYQAGVNEYARIQAYNSSAGQKLRLNPNGGAIQGGANCVNIGAGPFCQDYAEYYNALHLVDAAEIVVPDKNATDSGQFVTQSTKAYDNAAIGIVSSTPAVIIDNGIFTMGATTTGSEKVIPSLKPPVASAGRVPVKFVSTNGFVHIGDAITSSDVAGFGMKSTQAGPTVGKVVEDFNPSEGKDSQGTIPCPANSPSGAVCGKVMVLLNISWYDPDIYLTSTGDLNITNNPSSLTAGYDIRRPGEAPISRMGAFAEVAAASIRAGAISAQKTTTQSLTVATSNITIAGQSLNDYILSVVRSSDLVGSNNTISPLTEVDQIHTNVISPLAQGSNISIKLDNSSVDIYNNPGGAGQKVASIDNSGNATFSGTLNPQNLAVNQDATISGTLYASKIKADSIEGLEARLSTLSAQNITNVNNIYFATPSSDLSYNADGNNQVPSGTTSGSLLTPSIGYTDISSYSGFLAYVPNLSAATAYFTQNLSSSGMTTLADTSIAGQLSVQGTLILADNSINVLGAALQIQPLRQGDIAFEGGLIAMDTNGNLTIGGNATIQGRLATSLISPLAGQDLNINLATDSASTQQLKVTNASGSAVLAINNTGDITASGTGTFSKLNLSFIQPAYALSDTEVVATGSAGTTQILPYHREITIDNTLVTEKSLIYITPVGDTAGQVPYLVRQAAGISFSVGIAGQSNLPVQFNWLIVN